MWLINYRVNNGTKTMVGIAGYAEGCAVIRRLKRMTPHV